MKTFSQFYNNITEKQIVYGNNANYGQVVFFAGGAGSGKGFSISNFIDATKFKIRDVDALKTQLVKLEKLRIKYPELTQLKLSEPKDVFRLHQIAKNERIAEKQIEALFAAQNNPDTLANILFDTTLKDLDDVDTYAPILLKLGYKPENIHITWVLTNYSVAIVRNRARARVVPDDIMLKTHTGAALTIANILRNGFPKSINGSLTVILNNPESVSFYSKAVNDGSVIPTKIVKDFNYITLKRAGASMPSLSEMESSIKEKLLQWVAQNAPKVKEIQTAFGA